MHDGDSTGQNQNQKGVVKIAIEATHSVDFEDIFASKSGAVRDHMCTSECPDGNCGVRVDF